MFCQTCGTAINHQKANFCGNCGAEIIKCTPDREYEGTSQSTSYTMDHDSTKQSLTFCEFMERRQKLQTQEEEINSIRKRKKNERVCHISKKKKNKEELVKVSVFVSSHSQFKMFMSDIYKHSFSCTLLPPNEPFLIVIYYLCADQYRSCRG